MSGTPTNGHTVEADSFDWKSPNGRHYKCILAVGRGSRFVHARIFSSFGGGKSTYRERAGIAQTDVKRFLSEHWWPWIGTADQKFCRCDGDECFSGKEIETWLAPQGFSWTSSPEMPTGKIRFLKELSR